MKRKRDEGHEETDKILEDMEKRIAEEYKQAEKEISEKLNDYLRRFEAKDRIKQQALADGLITQKEYDKWLTGQIMIGKRWTEMRDTLAEDFTNADKIAKSIAYGYQPEVYALNHNYGTYQVENGAQVDTSYTLYDRNTVERLFNDNETFYHAPGEKVSARINEGKALAWNKKQVQSCMLQGILQGESIPNMATRLANTVGEQNRKAAIRNARTMTTGVENAGRVRSYDRAQSMGINVQKQWLATLDNRTRHWHRELDGVSVPNDEPFKNEFGEIMYPGDPTADGSNIYNCRCTLIANIKGFENDVTNRSLRHDSHLGDMSYDEWKEEKKSTSDPITKQDEIADAMKRAYGREYNWLKNQNNKAIGEDVLRENSTKSTDKHNFKVKFDYESEDFAKRIEALGENEQTTHTMVNEIRAMLRHRDGTKYEDLVFINTNSDSKPRMLKQTGFNVESMVKPTREMEKMAEKNPNIIIGIHNHPLSSAPSFDDLMSAGKRKYKYGLVVCHDGTIYKYTTDKMLDDGLEYAVELKMSRLQEAVSYRKKEDIENIFNEVYKEFGIKMEVFY